MKLSVLHGAELNNFLCVKTLNEIKWQTTNQKNNSKCFILFFYFHTLFSRKEKKNVMTDIQQLQLQMKVKSLVIKFLYHLNRETSRKTRGLLLWRIVIYNLNSNFQLWCQSVQKFRYIHKNVNTLSTGPCTQQHAWYTESAT